MQHQLQVCNAAAPLSARHAIAPSLLLQLRQRCSLRPGLQVVRAGEKKKLKQHVEALAEVHWRHALAAPVCQGAEVSSGLAHICHARFEAWSWCAGVRKQAHGFRASVRAQQAAAGL
jgi:hypothetical protein